MHALLALLLVCELLICCLANAEESSSNTTEEYSIKAAFIFNFAKFIDWPADTFTSSTAPLHICLFGRNTFGSAFDLVRHKKVQGREIQITIVADEPDFKICQILFIGIGEDAQLTRIFDTLSRSPILTIGDRRNFARIGGMINLVLVDNKVHFEINTNAARKANLRISSKLLNLATIIDNPIAEKHQ